MKVNTTIIIYFLLAFTIGILASCEPRVDSNGNVIKPIRTHRITTTQYYKYVVRKTTLGKRIIHLDSTIINRQSNDTIHRTYFTTLSR